MSRRRHPVRIIGPVVLVVALLALTTPTPSAARTDGDPATTTSTGPSVTTTTEAPGTAAADPAPLRVVSQPAAVDPDGRFTVTLEVRGAAGGDVVVDIYDRVTDRIGLIESQTGSLTNSRATFEPIPLEDETGSQRVTFTIYLHDRGQSAPDGAGYWARQLTEPGAYPIKIRLRDAAEKELASAVTYLVRRPSPDVTSPIPKVAVLLTLTAPGPGQPDLDLDRANRVIEALDEHPDLPVTLTVDPDLLDRMTRPADGTPPDPEAVAFVDDLDRVTGRDDAEVLGAPFTDVDPAQLTTSGLGNSLADQARIGAEVNDDLLGTAGTTTWWVPHRLDAASAFGLRVAGVEHLVLAPSSLIGAAPLVPTPIVDLDPAFTVVSTASDLPVGDTADPELAAQRWFGALVADATIAGGTGSATVARLSTESVDLDTLDRILTLLDEHPEVVEASTVSGLFDETSAASTPMALAAPEVDDLTRYVEARERLVGRLASYGTMRVDDAASPLGAEELELARTERAGLTVAERLAGLRSIERSLEQTFAPISTATSDRITLGAREATVPLPIESTATEPLRVRIHLSSSNRLEFPRNDIEAIIEPGRTTVSIPIEARTSGDIPMEVTITTPDGGIVLAQSRYTIRSTAVSGVGIVLTVGAAGFLALWWGRHILRSRRRPPDAEPDETAPDHPGDDPTSTAARPAPTTDLDDDAIFVDEPADAP